MSEQSLHALRIANQTRIGASVLRAELAAKVITLEKALEDPRAQCMPVGRLLTAQPAWGPTKAHALLNYHHIWPTRRVRDLTPRQRQMIVEKAPSFGPGGAR